MEGQKEKSTSIEPLQRPHYINLNWGKPSPSLLPTDALLSATRGVLSQPSIWETALLYGASDGYMPLRQSITAWLHRYYGSKEDAEHICITGGASQNLMNVLAVLTDPLQTRAVWMTSPCFYLACRMFEDAGLSGKLKAVREMEGGDLDLEELERRMQEVDDSSLQALKRGKINNLDLKPQLSSRKIYSHVIYVVPTFNNPSGRTIPLPCRESLMHLARKHNALIISDDIYDCLQWTTSAKNDIPSADSTMTNGITMANGNATVNGNNQHQSETPTTTYDAPDISNAAPTRLVDIDRALPLLATDPSGFRHTLSNGSFSKIVAPGVRTGWVDASPAICAALASCGASISGGCPSAFMAAVMHQLMVRAEGRWLNEHIGGTLVPAYRQRRGVMVREIGNVLGPLGCKCVDGGEGGREALVGGFFVWVALPEGLKGTEVARSATEWQNLVVCPGTWFTVTGDVGKDDYEGLLRLSFSFVSELDLVEGVRRLGNVIEALLQGKE
ncbi:putative secondary metabolism biosynthetic enzyme [Bacidia gigantensis]|uniref:putative secondary metabolism biosynthetic enzyme n=1 Tax=Bacidia gigantensis TaxID=2732470 RepID=UPI001D049BD2|nr:putative secondary metabolism biosynthetic enzyme [Bacidia gigantensis]KAG8525195.1 putative secondary metabolism biosynthetic enzyme [Bacidia gigantensis]